ncbi:retrotransposon protein, putative, ty1-copia subclass [Tanacetum coccineum]
MASMKYCDKHNQVGFLKKPEESTRFAEIVDFLKGSHITYALTHNLTIHDSLVKQFWQTATATTLADGTLELSATIDTLEYTIIEASVRSKLHLADASGISMLPNNEIFEGMGNMGYPTDDQAVDQPSPSEPLPSSSHPPIIFATIESEPTPVAESTPHPKSPSPEPDSRSTKHTFDQPSPEHQPLLPRQETEIPQSQDPTHPYAAEATTMTMDDLLHLVPKLITKVDSLETELKQTKLTMGHAIVKLVKKVKKMEAVLKRRHVVLPDSEDEDAENSSKQGRNLQEEGLDEMVRNIMKDKSEVFKTPTQGKTSREADISPEGLEAAETLAKVFTQRTKTYTRKVKTGLRRKLDADEVSTGKEINTGFTDVSTAFTDVNTAFEEINSGDERIILSPKKGQREGKADALIAKRMQNELELSETQKNRMAQVQEAAKYYTEEDWDLVRAKLEASRDLSSKVFSIDFFSDDFAKKMLKKLKPDELKEEFDKCVEKVKKFNPMNSELEASKLKRAGINLQAEVSKKQKITDVPDVTKVESKNKSESARSNTEEDVEAYMDERVDEPSSEEFQIGSIPQGLTPTKIVKWQIIKTSKKGAYQIIREDHTDVVYVNFPGLLNDLTRYDLKELYRLMMLKYEDSRPEEEYERVFCVVHCLTLEAAHIYMLTEVKYPLPSRVCQAMLEKRLIGDRKDEFSEPANYKATLLDPESETWLAAMNVEIQSMKDNDVWELVELPHNAKTIGYKWLFKKKTDMDGVVHIFKSRLVAKGFTQTYGVDYEETFSPVADIRAIRILIAIAAYYVYEIWQIDVKIAFLKGHLYEEVYMTQPEGFVNPKYPNHVCKLKRSIYGLKQASRQ